MKLLPNINTFKGKLYFSMLVSMLSMLLLFILYNYGYNILVNQTAANTFDSISEEMGNRLNVEIEIIEEASRQISYSTVIQEYILAEDPLTRFNRVIFAKEIMDIAVQSSDNIANIAIFPYNSNNYLTYNSNSQTLNRAAAKDYNFSNSLSLNLENAFFSKIYYNENENIPYCYYFLPVYNILPGGFDKENIAICAVLCNLEAIAGELGSGMTESGVAILSYEGEVISTSRQLTENEELIYNSSDSDSVFMKVKGETYLIKSREVPETGWQYTAITAKAKLTEDLLPLRTIGFGLIIVTAILNAFIISASIRSISRPFSQIIIEMSLLESGEEISRISIPKEVEVSHIAKEINKMLERIETSARVARETQQKLYDSVLAQQKAELLSYRSQINPHFLFNTLECLRSMAHETKSPIIEKMCVSMANMFNYSLYSGTTTILEKEIANTKNYFYVLSQRFPDRYQLKFDIFKDDMSHTVPTMFLQPIVENCIMHGFIKKKPPCIILIQSVATDDNTLIVKIIDNGNGMKNEEVANINNMLSMKEGSSYGKNSIGLYNINQRMLRLFGERYKLKVKSKQGFYTIIEVIIPKRPT